MADEIKDETTETIITDETDETGNVIPDGDEKGTPTPDEVKLEKAKEDAQAKLDKILEKHGYDSAEDLEEDLDSGKAIKELLGNRDAAEVVKQAEKMERTEAWWDELAEKKLQEEEDPEETAKRWEKRAKDAEGALKAREGEIETIKKNEEIFAAYESEVSSFVRAEDVPKEYRSFVLKLMGVGNPFNEIDISNKAAIRKVAKGLLKEAKDYEQAIIKRYRQGKVDTPVITKTDTTPTPNTTKKSKTMEERAVLLKESLTKILSK